MRPLMLPRALAGLLTPRPGPVGPVAALGLRGLARAVRVGPRALKPLTPCRLVRLLLRDLSRRQRQAPLVPEQVVLAPLVLRLRRVVPSRRPLRSRSPRRALALRLLVPAGLAPLLLQRPAQMV